jgi:hypothetical protein
MRASCVTALARPWPRGGLRVLAIESLSLLTAGLRARVGVAALELGRAPWRAALGSLTLPLATALLLVWTFGFVPRYDHWPLGEGWVLLLGGSLTAVVGAALRSRWLTAGGAAATFVAAAAPYLGFGVEAMSVSSTPSFFRGWNVDFGVASLLPTLLLVAGGLSLPRGPRPARGSTLIRLTAAVLPAATAAVFLLPYAAPKPTVMHLYTGPHADPIVQVGPPYPLPWLPPSRGLTLILAIALAVAVVAAWQRSRTHPERALATGLVLASIAYPLTWVATRTEAFHMPYWMLNGPNPLLLTVLPALLALALMRRAGRAGASGAT